MKLRVDGAVILDFDIENRPVAYLGPDYTTAQITAIAWKFVNPEGKVKVQALGETTVPHILEKFVKAYNKADVVTGHYILRHDLPVINGALIELGMEPLAPKLVQDTKIHMTDSKYLSMSQENLGYMLGLDNPKAHMNNAMWREANTLTKKGIALTKERCVADVLQHVELRQKLLERGLLGAPTQWRG